MVPVPDIYFPANPAQMATGLGLLNTSRFLTWTDRLKVDMQQPGKEAR